MLLYLNKVKLLLLSPVGFGGPRESTMIYDREQLTKQKTSN
jgi:hypothetical protein